MSLADAAEGRSRLTRWVTESQTGNPIFGTKGRLYRHESIESLARQLKGRLSEGDAKNIEKELAKQTYDNENLRIRMQQLHKLLQNKIDRLNDDDHWRVGLEGAKDKYGFYWCGSLFGSKKSIWAGLRELSGKWGKNPSCTTTAAWLADFGLAQRTIKGGTGSSMKALDQDADKQIGQWFQSAHQLSKSSYADGNTKRYNVLEDSQWVIAARTGHVGGKSVRIGAGPSGTTYFALWAVDHLLTGEQTYEKQRDLLNVAFSLFTFWNRHRDKLQAYAEVHTYHEVMCIAWMFGVTGARPAGGGDFEYYDPHDMPRLG